MKDNILSKEGIIHEQLYDWTIISRIIKESRK
jgi:hypothetical protein